ncbi:hypothetical protein N311_08618, partial [Apaloderma vittatum]
AIDFLLLTHGHGCEDFAGMCCFNLTDRSQSIYSKLQELKDNMKKLQRWENPFDTWLESL